MAQSRVQHPEQSLIREHLFDSIWNSSIDGIRLIDDGCCIVMVNPAYCSLVHKPEEELVGKNFSTVYSEETRDALLDEMRRCIAAGIAHDIVEREYALWDGGKKCFEVSNALVEPESGKLYVMSIIRDRTEHKRKDEAIEMAEKQFRMLYENAPLSYQSLDEDGRIMNVNPTWLSTLGYERKEVIGRKFEEFLPPAAARYLAEVLQKLRQQGEVHNIELEMVRKSGEHIFVNYEGKIARDETGAFRQTHCIFTDITERKKTEAELQKMYIQTRKYAHLKDELLNEVNHRVKNNLMTILGLILAEKRRPDGSKMRDRSALWDEFELKINGLLKVHQMLSDSQWAPLNVSDLVQRIIGGVVSIYEPVVSASLHVGQSSIVVSPRQANNLALVLNELSTNSLKHAFGGVAWPEIHVNIWTEAGDICIEFRDNGSGYPDNVLTRNMENVGLHLVRQIIQETLRGEVKLFNRDGAVAMLTIKAEEISRT